MYYARPAFGDPSVKTTMTRKTFGGAVMRAPVFDTPISRRENFFRAAHRDHPRWVPIPASDIQDLHINQLATPQGETQLGPDFIRYAKEDYRFFDIFGNSWTWVASAGGAMLTPGTKLVDDICDWEKQIRFPDFNSWDFRETAEKYMKEEYDPEKVMHINIHQGLTEMLVAFLGGYGEGMLAMAVEPEAVKAFFDRYAQYMIDFFDLLDSLYPIDFITYHDDWGTERDTFFSAAMMEDLVFEPTKRIIDHIKGRGKVFELHSCGRIERFLPYMCDLGVDFLQIQRRANDMPALKEKYGDRIGFMAGIEGIAFGKPCSDAQLAELIKNTVEIYAPGGGFYPVLFGTTEEILWKQSAEMYCCSREFYDRENGLA